MVIQCVHNNSISHTLYMEFTCLFVQDRSTLDAYLIAPKSFEETW